MEYKLSIKKKKKSNVLVLNHVLIIASLILSSCVNDKKVNSKANAKNNVTKNAPLQITISSVEVVNNQVIIKGTNLTGVTKFAIKDGSSSSSLQIESQSANQIIANTLSDVTFTAGKILDFVFSNAEAASTFTVNFSLCDSLLGGKGFNCNFTPNDKDVLSYDANTGKWRPRAVNGLSYVGAWDPINDPLPSAVNPGDYFIVSAADGTYNVGDWVVFNGHGFDRIENADGITSVFGRTGAVTGKEGDYVLDKMADVDLTLVPPLSGDVLKFNGSKWVPGTVSAGVASGTIADADLSPSANISQSKINGLTAALAGKEPAITASTSSKYFRGDKTFATLNTSVVPESVNLYFTNARVLGVPLTGFSTLAGSVVSTDTVVQAIGKLQGQLNLKADAGAAVDWSAAGPITIDPSHLSLGAAYGSKAVVTNGSGFIVAGGATAAEVGYLSGTTSNIQTQLNNKQSTITKSTTQDLNKVRIYGANTTNYIEITAPAISGNKTLTLPDTDGANGNALITDGAGTLRWGTVGGGGGGGGTPDPGSVTNTEVSATANIAQSKIANLTTDLAAKEASVAAGTTAQYYRGDKSWQTLNTTAVAEGSNLYFTNARALGVPLTGFSTATTTAVVATDTALQAFGKLQGQVGLKLDSSSFVNWQISGVQTIDPSRLSLGAGNASKVVVTNGSGFVVAGGATATEVGHLSGVTSAIQTQLNTKLATVSRTTTQEISKVRVYGANATNYAEISVPVLSANTSFVLPDTNGANGQVLTTDGFGTLRWAAGGGGGGGGGTPDPGSVTNTEVSASANIAQSKIANLTTDLAAKEATVAAGTTLQYYRGDKSWQTLNTTAVTEGSNLYFTNARALGVPLTGFSTATTTAVVATDTALQAFGKLQGQMNLKADSSSFVDWQVSGVQTIDPSRLSLGAGNAGKAVVTNGSGLIVAGGATSTEVGYLSGVTSAVQTQLNAKLSTVSKTTTQDIGKVRIYAPNAINYVEVSAPTMSVNTSITYPDNNGTNGQVLTTDGAGTLRWSTVSGGGGGGTPDPGSVTNTEVSATANIAQSKIANLTTDLAAKEASIAAGTTLQYYRGDKSWQTLNTTAVAEGTNLYFTNARVLLAPLTGLVATDAVIAAADTTLQGFNKAQGQINNRVKKNGDSMSGDLVLETKLRFKDSGSNHVEMVAPSSVTPYTMTLPSAKATVAGQALTSDTSGNLSWTTISGGGGSPTGAAGGDLSGTYPNPTISGLDATKLATGVVDNTEFNYLNGVTSSIQTQLDSKQTTNATLTALAGYSTDGFMVQTAANTFEGRSIAGTMNRVTVSNADGVAGNPTINVSTNLLPSPGMFDGGKILKATGMDTAAWGTIDPSDINAAIGYTPMRNDGEVLTTGTFNFSGAAILRTDDPVALTDVANKQYVDSFGQWSKGTGGNLGDIYFPGVNDVGIGTSTPETKLHVAAGSVTIDVDRMFGTNLTSSNQEHSYTPMISGFNEWTGLADGLDNPLNGMPYSNSSLFLAQKMITFGRSDGLYDIIAYMNLADKEFIWDGKIGLGTKTPTDMLHIKSDSNTAVMLENSTASTGRKYSIESTPTGELSIMDKTAAAERLNISSTGLIGIGTTPEVGFSLKVNGLIKTTGAVNTTSDKRLKKNITPVKDALDKLSSITGVYYDWRNDEYPEMNFDNRHQLGLIAQDVEKVFPEAVSKNENGFRSVAYTMLIAPLIEGVKELYNRLLGIEKVQSVQTRQIASVEAKMKKLETENAQLKASDKAKEQKIKKLEQRLELIEKALSSKK